MNVQDIKIIRTLNVYLYSYINCNNTMIFNLNATQEIIAFTKILRDGF